jgi:(1->4)-alpha-D-glucan 1-alpha-D-glucosylmutase
VVHRALALRRRLPEVFDRGDYVPLVARGSHAEHVVAFARRHADSVAITVVPRLPLTLSRSPEVAPLAAVWGDTELTLPGGLGARHLTSVLTGKTLDGAAGRLALAELLREIPCALVVGSAREEGRFRLANPGRV